MHEATIAQSILEILAEQLEQTPSDRIVAARVLIGEFRNIEIESLSFSFDSLKKHYYGISECLLECETIPTVALCRKEKHSYHPTFENGFRCEICKSGIGAILQGEELNIVSAKTTHFTEEIEQYA